MKLLYLLNLVFYVAVWNHMCTHNFTVITIKMGPQTLRHYTSGTVRRPRANRIRARMRDSWVLYRWWLPLLWDYCGVFVTPHTHPLLDTHTSWGRSVSIRYHICWHWDRHRHIILVYFAKDKITETVTKISKRKCVRNPSLLKHRPQDFKPGLFQTVLQKLNLLGLIRSQYTLAHTSTWKSRQNPI